MMHLPNSIIANYYTFNSLHIKKCLRFWASLIVRLKTLARNEDQCLASHVQSLEGEIAATGLMCNVNGDAQ